MPNPFKRGQAVTFESKGRTGKITKGTGTFKSMGERGRCVIRLEDGGEAAPYLSQVQAADAQPPHPKAPRTAKRPASAAARSTARGRASTRTPAQTAGKPAKQSPARKAASSGANTRLAAIEAKLDLILSRLNAEANPNQPRQVPTTTVDEQPLEQQPKEAA